MYKYAPSISVYIIKMKSKFSKDKEITMKAISITAPKTIEVKDVPIPELEDDEILIKVAYTGICGTDIGIYGGGLSFVKSGLIKYPVRIGHEFSGVVEKVGKNVTKFKKGDRVITDNGVSCRHCKPCLEGRNIDCENMRSVGTVNCWEGAFAEYVKFPEIHVYHLPDSIDLDEAAVIEPVTISLVSLDKIDGRNPGKTILVIGTGPIGLATANLAINYGAKKVYIAGRKENKLAIAREYGAEAINVTETDLVEYFKAKGEKVDAVIETSGAIGCIEQAIKCTKKHGTVALAGFYERTLDEFPIDDFVFSEVNLVGVAGRWVAQDIIDLIVAGKLNLKPLITHRFSFDEAPAAIAEGDTPKYKDKIRMLVEVDPSLK